ncbi:MAG: CobW family GTP-binding protein [Planctomycetota bacterium]
MIPICLVTGFLGSGKTTFLKNHIRRTSGRRFVYIVNDFSAVDIDGLIVSELDANVVSVAGGSIFCRCVVTDFIKTLKSVQKDFAGIEGVIIEASGIASPGVISSLLAETGLDRVFSLRSIIGIVDPGSVNKLLETLPAIVDQIQSSDVLLINKSDAYDSKTLAAVEETLRQINSSAIMIRTQFSDTAIDPFEPQDHEDLSGEFAKCRDPHFASFSIEPREDLTAASVKTLIEKHIRSIYRLKGFMLIDGDPHYVDVSGGVISIQPHPAPVEKENRVLALITPGGSTKTGEKIKKAFERTR